MTISYIQSSNFGTAGTFTTLAAYKELTTTVGFGDLLIAWGGSSSSNGVGAATITTQAGLTDPWNVSMVDGSGSCGFIIGDTIAEAAGSVTVRIAPPAATSAAKVGVGLWVISADSWLNAPNYTSIGPGDSTGQASVAVPVTSSVLVAWADKTAGGANNALTPAGGTIDTLYADDVNWGAWAAHWSTQAAGTRLYGATQPVGFNFVGAAVDIPSAGGGTPLSTKGFLQLENFGNLLLEDNLNSLLI